MRRALLVSIGLLTLAASAASAAAAAPQLRAGDRIDALALHLLVPSADHLQIRIAVGADIDADGDIDVVATTDHDLVVWINDGGGHFRRRAAHRHPIVDGQSAPDTWSGGPSGSTEVVQSGTVLMPMIVARAHAPPIAATGLLRSLYYAVRSDACLSSRSPRAPPTPLS
jgi:hypothetical protein